MENKKINIKLFTSRALLIATLLGGPIAGALMLARNFKQISAERAARRSIFQGILAVLFLYAALLLMIGLKKPFPDGLIWGEEMKLIIALSTILKLLFGVFVYLRIPPLLREKTNELRYMNKLTEEKTNRASIHMIAWYTAIGFFTFPISLALLINVTGTLFILSFYFSFFIYSRAKKIYSGKLARILSFFILLVIVASSPLAWHEYDRPGPRIFLLLFFYSLVVIGYLFLFTAGLDALVAINRHCKIIPDHLLKNKKTGKLSSYLIIMCVTVLIIHGHYNVVNPRIRTYDIQVQKKHSHLNKLKIIAAADLHLSNLTGPHFLNDIVDKINSLNPDLVIIAGDITVERSSITDWKNYDVDFRKIKSRYGVYTIIGNHELRYNPEKTLQFIEHSNMSLLQDKAVNINGQFYVLGRNDKSNLNRKSLAEIMKDIKDDLPVIMVEHRISEMEKIEAQKIDLHISGHTHAGQLFPANLLMELIYRINWGYKKFQGTHFFVTSGVGTWGPPVRVGSFSEIMEINVTFK